MMKNSPRSGAFSAILATGISQLLSGLEALLLPLYLTQEAYGWWHTYLLYAGFAGILHFGWVDGHYLRIGGRKLESLDSHEESGQLLLLAIFELLLCGLFLLVSHRFLRGTGRMVSATICISALLSCLRDYILYTYQATGCIRRYSILILLEKLLSSFLLTILLLMGQRDIAILLISDLAARLLTLLSAIVLSCGVFSSKPFLSADSIMLVKEHISNGFTLLLATLMSMLTLSAVRFILQWRWGIVKYGQASLCLSLAALLLKLVSAGAVVIFPALRRMPPEKRASYYQPGALLSLALISLVLILYRPAELLLSRFLPDYAESFRCAVFLLGGIGFGCRSSLLITPGMNALNQQKKLFFCNFLGASTAAATALFFSGTESLMLGMIAAGVGLFVSTFAGELSFCRILQISARREWLEEMAIFLIFTVLNGFCGFLGSFIYAIIILLWLFCSRSRLIEAWKYLRSPTC